MMPFYIIELNFNLNFNFFREKCVKQSETIAHNKNLKSGNAVPKF